MARCLAVLVVLAAVCGMAAAASDELTASPMVVTSSGDPLTLKWTVALPTELDTVALYSGADTSAPLLGFFNVSGVAGWSTGTGSISFPLANMRVPYTFAYLSGMDQTPVATTQPVSFAEPNEPTQVRLAFGEDDTTMSVMWVTRDDLKGSVRWGTSASALTHTAAATTATYTVEDMCTAPANTTEGFLDPGTLNTAVMTGLPYSRRIYYQVGSGTGATLSPVLSFLSPQPVQATTETRVFAFGDLGTTVPWITTQEQQPPSQLTVNWIEQTVQDLGDIPSSVLHIGDISYARGWAFLWEYFGQLIAPVAQKVPWMVAIGNHEYDFPGQPFDPSWAGYGDDSGGECGIPYERRFAMPGNNRNLWYSYNVGNIHVLIFSTEHNFTTGSPQFKFMEADLAGVNRSVTPWVIVAGHRPMYSSSAGHNIGQGRDTDNLQTHMLHNLEPMLVANDVDLALWGHVHKYERTCGVVNFTCAESDNDAPVHMVVGSAGNVFQVNWASSLAKSPDLQNAGHHVQPRWSIFRAGEFGFARIHTNATHLHAEFVGDQRGAIHDQMWLTRKA